MLPNMNFRCAGHLHIVGKCRIQATRVWSHSQATAEKTQMALQP